MMLTLAEKLLLIGLNDETGKVHYQASTALPYGLAGAVLADLMLLGKVELQGKNIVVVDPKPVGQPIFDKALHIINKTPRKRNAKYWVQRLKRDLKTLRQDVLTLLIEQGILKEEKRKILGLFETRTYPAVDGEMEEQVKEKLRVLVLQPTEIEENKELAQERTLVLLSLVNACDLLRQVFDRQEARVVKKQVKHLTKDVPVSKAVKEMVDAINASVVLAITSAAVVTSSSSSSN
ncbi:GPP34 family phosphoprotein [Halalkalibacterium halodurans]|jgi:hypothetical protein|nr:GPP34 family phosphoprotein [Halalkalibacterium halodurans]MDY7221331.1 GPP34 family phosphoprotein [Halalkalibacterium halodurans]MDY7240570.1 GPP34 family phosphoprotein [Halalkalibacterium halodurans]MED3648455.1 GPP34 family phosphoprotein [Halalkalibacterium halodurans]MED4081396.1 GPP34 family phosphoprotein [Halalkalibacterium halodurans]MED4083322.1 GPP34 family phosphoprotein [Halalkalibacterium halodurans]